MLPIYERIGKLCKLKKTTINEMMIAVAPEDAKSPRDIYNGWRRLSCCRITLTKQAKKATNFCLRTGAVNALTSSLAESENVLNFHRRRTAITWTTSKTYFKSCKKSRN